MNRVIDSAGSNVGLLDALIDLSKNGILVLSFGQTPLPWFKVVQANEPARALMVGMGVPLIGAHVEHLPPPFRYPTLVGPLHQAIHQLTPVRFPLWHPVPASGALAQYDCQLIQVGNQRMLFSIELVERLPERGQLLEQVVETMPTGVILFRAIRDGRQAIVDFQAVLCNQLGAAISHQSRETILTQPISQRYPDMRAYALFHHYVNVVTTGQPHHQRLYLPSQALWLNISVVKYEDGVLVSLQDVTSGERTASLLESVMSSSPAAVRYYESIRDESGRIVDFMSSTGNELAAYRPYRPDESMMGQRMLALYPYLKDEGLFDRYVAVVESGQGDRFETSHQVNDRVVWFDCTAVSHGDGFVLTTLDITDRKEALQAQQRQAGLLQTVLDNSLTGIAWLQTVLDTQGQLVDFTFAKVNATLAQTLQKSPLIVEGQALSAVLPHQMSNGLFERYATVARTGEPQRFVWANKTATVWYDISAVAVPDGLIVTFMDISATKLAEVAQQQQADLLQGVLNSSASSILVLDPVLDEFRQISDFRIRLANPTTLRLFTHFLGHDLTPEVFLNNTLLTLFPAVKERALFAALVTVADTQQPIHTPVDYPQLGLTYDYDLTPFREGVLMITTDITPLRVYQQQLEANNIALSRSNEYLQQFAYVASHDLQEPLRKIQTFSDLLLTQHAEGLDDSGRDLLRRQQQAAHRMQALVKDLLAYARLTNQETPHEPVSLQQLAEEVLSDLETTIRETNAQVNVGNLPTIDGDATQLRQLIQNLLANALKFTKPHQPPRVWVEASQLTANELPHTPLAKDGSAWIALRVADEGIGFDELHGERMFELFHRLHGRSQYNGTGIGLAVVKKVVDNHRGHITAHSQPGAGAVFTIYLPVA